MAALVQTYTPQTATVAMLHTRPKSASGMLQSHQGQQYHQQPQGSSQPRNSYHGGLQGPTGGQVVYRGSVGPVQPYAFTSTPSLNQTVQWQPPAAFHRASSASALPTVQTIDRSQNGGRSRYLASASMTNLPITSTVGTSMGGSRDDSSIPSTATRRIATTFTPPYGQTAKPSPERYRRPAPRNIDTSAPMQHGHGQQQPGSAPPSGSGMASVNHLYNQRSEQQRRNSFVGAMSGSAVADEGVQLTGAFSAADAAARVRRRSLPALDSAEFIKPLTPLQIDLTGNKQPEESLTNRLDQPLSSPRPKSAGKEQQQHLTANDAAAVQRTKAAHGRTGSSDSRVSSRSSSSRPSSVSFAQFATGSLAFEPSNGRLDPSISASISSHFLHNRTDVRCTTSNHALVLTVSPCKLMQSLTKPFPHSLRTATPMCLSPLVTPPCSLRAIQPPSGTHPTLIIPGW